MFCEEYKQLETELDAARGEWIYFRLTVSNRAAGVTETHSKEMIQRAKAKMDEIKNRMSLHLNFCDICNRLRRLA